MMPDRATQAMLIAVLGAGHLVGHYRGIDSLRRTAKGLPIVLLIVTVVGLPAPVAGPYRWLVAAALTASLAGDLFLLSRVRFRAGLASFLLAHVLYILAFCSGPWTVPSVGWGAAVAATTLAMLAVLWSHLGHERIPVACYVTAIAAMGWTAAGRMAADAPGGALVVLGALTFMVSDATLAVDRFVGRFAAAQAVVMVTYYAAQTMLAWSVAG
jgi:uncharacterized membrane protein YhhN